MFVEDLSIQNLRSLGLLSFNPHRKINIILGKNNVGKTTVLESIYIGSRLKTFKQTPIPNLIKHNETFLKILLNVSRIGEKHLICIEKSLKSHNIAKNNLRVIGAKEIARLFPVLALAFGNENIINQPSEFRRSILDWGLFHVEHNYLSILHAYQRCLKQRNYLLKKGSAEEISYWTMRLAESGNKISALRKEYFKHLNNKFKAFVEKARQSINKPHADIFNISLAYAPGWDDGEDLISSIDKNIQKDRALGFTEYGPHKADILIESNDLQLRKIGSMSSQVLASLLLTLSQSEVFHVKHNFRPILLIDDLFFGIDDTNLMLVLELLVQAKTQCFLTAPDIYREKLVGIGQETADIQLYVLGNQKITKVS